MAIVLVVNVGKSITNPSNLNDFKFYGFQRSMEVSLEATLACTLKLINSIENKGFSGFYA